MSYQMQLASVATPAEDLDVFPFMNKLRQEAGEQPPSALLKRFHDALAALFPDTPWAEGHFAGDAGRLTVVRRRKVVVPHVLYIAGELGLTVVDNQSGEIHRPPSYQVVLEGPAEGVELGDASARLAALMRKPVTEMLALLSGGRRTVVKKGVTRFVAEQYANALREKAGCRTTLAHESGPAPREKPPVPPIVLAPKIVEQPKEVMPPMSRTAAKAAADAEAALDKTLTANGTDEELYEVAEGVRLICCSIVLSILLRGALVLMPPVPAAFSSLIMMLLEVYGVMRLTSGLRYGGPVRTVLLLAVLSPLILGIAGPFLKLSLSKILGAAVVSFLVMAVLGIMGSRRLSKAGYKTGLFGASKADVRYLGAMGASERLQSTTLAWGTFFLVFAAYMTSGMQGNNREVSPVPYSGTSSTTGTGGASLRELTDLPSAQAPCKFVGNWEVESGVGKYMYQIGDDGKYTAFQVSGQPREGGTQWGGRWSVARDSLYLSDETRVPAKVTQSRVASSDPTFFAAAELKSAQVLMFNLKERGKSLRCNY